MRWIGREEAAKRIRYEKHLLQHTHPDHSSLFFLLGFYSNDEAVEFSSSQDSFKGNQPPEDLILFLFLLSILFNFLPSISIIKNVVNS